MRQATEGDIFWRFDSTPSITTTKKKKEELLQVLDYPRVLLHNNLAEVDVREGVIKRKIRYGTGSELGRLAWENMLSIMNTCESLV